MTVPTQHWLIGVDTSSESLHALQWAMGQAGGHDEVHLRALFAIEPAYYGFSVDGGGELPLATTEMEHLAAVRLKTCVQEVVRPFGSVVDTSIAIGPPAAVMLEAGNDADLIVVGSRGRGGFAALLLGSVSLQLAVHADVPVVVVPGVASTDRTRSVVVGVDGSHNALAALAWACELAGDETEITAVGVWRPPFVELQAVEPPSRDDAKRRFFESVEEVSRAFDGRTIVQRFITGDARHVLAETAADADLLVVGARGYDGVRGALMGSVSTWALHHARCATAVIPAPPCS